jgi:hypothetical protein
MFYNFDQNNSGGSFDEDQEKGIGYVVIIEADNAKEANEKAEKIGIYFHGVVNNGDCECCGDRWHEVDESDGTELPEYYGQVITDKVDNKYWTAASFIHYKDGTIKKV